MSFNGSQDRGNERARSNASKADSPVPSDQTISALTSQLSPGDLVIHSAHGLGRFAGLKSLDTAGGPDVFEIEYQDGRLLVPISELSLLFRFGASEGMQLDRLKSKNWNVKRRAALRKIDATARQLIGLEANRSQITSPTLKARASHYRRFCAGFEFDPTADQSSAFEDVERDLANTTPMDRLVCGDVGCGKTEVAMRAAFIAADAGFQVAVVVPSTLLARQHAERFRERFKAFKVEVSEASRLMSRTDLARLKSDLAKDTPRIVIGTHTLVDENISWGKLGLVIVDEEHRFGVEHKEKLKRLTKNVHVLTLSATPIPRTLQMALSSIRDLSLINTLPLRRRPVETKVIEGSGKAIGDALRAERRRGGVSFFVCPKISDLEKARSLLAAEAPELRIITAHGDMPTAELKRAVETFSSRQFDVLLCTTIIEAGLDVASANTLIVYDAHRLGLAQLYQLRGRVGRSQKQARAYFIVPEDAELSATAKRRMEAVSSLNAAGAGFAVACQDLEIRGAGTVAGDTQSGHIKELGIELFRTMLKRAVEAVRSGNGADWADIWAPRLALDVEAAIPAAYISDEAGRIELYWQLARADDEDAIARLRHDAEERFGALPGIVENVFQLAKLRCSCLARGIEEITVGPRGGLLKFRNASVLREMQNRLPGARVKQDALVLKTPLRSPQNRLAWALDTVAALSSEPKAKHPIGLPRMELSVSSSMQPVA